MKSMSVFFLAITFFFRHLKKLAPFLILPLLATMILFGGIFLGAYQLIDFITATFSGSDSGFLSQAILVSSQVLGGLLVALLAYVFFIPIWQLLIMPWLEDFSLKTLKIYAQEHNLILTKNKIHFLPGIFVSSKISLSIFLRQIFFRLLLMVLIFLNPILGTLSIFVEFICNYLFGSYEYFYPLVQHHDEKVKNYAELKNLLGRKKYLPPAFRAMAALNLSFPVLNFWGIFLNAIAAAILFGSTPQSAVHHESNGQNRDSH